jgi:hypothetical protein
MLIRVHPLPLAQRQFEMRWGAFHSLRLIVGMALGLVMAGDLDVVSDPLAFYQESWRRKIVLGERDRAKLAALHPGAQDFFNFGQILESARATAMAAFIETIPELPFDEEVWRKRLGEFRHDLLCATSKSVNKSVSFFYFSFRVFDTL